MFKPRHDAPRTPIPIGAADYRAALCGARKQAAISAEHKQIIKERV